MQELPSCHVSDQRWFSQELRAVQQVATESKTWVASRDSAIKDGNSAGNCGAPARVQSAEVCHCDCHAK